MTFSNYFGKELSRLEEIMAAVVVRRDWKDQEYFANLLPQSQRSKFRLLLVALQEMSIEKQSLLAGMTIEQFFSKSQE